MQEQKVTQQLMDDLCRNVNFDSVAMCFRGVVYLSDEDPDELWMQ